MKRYEMSGNCVEYEYDNGQWVLFDDCEKPLAIAETAVKYVRLSQERIAALNSGTSFQEDVAMCDEITQAWAELIAVVGGVEG